ncbi:MAG: DUF2294 domain-containing protein [Phycisphaerae bacterium]|nr:DUF2294 domain-containing protein [Phycisphaerae bacterium]
MDESGPTMARQIAEVAVAFERQRTGHAPKAVNVILGQDTLVITLRGALSSAEKALAANPTGAAQLRELHRQLFAAAFEPLRTEIERITGVRVCDATAEIETAAGTVVEVFMTGTVVQVFLLAEPVAAEVWSEGVAPG